MKAGDHRGFAGKAWLVNGLRVLHLAGVIGVGAAVVTGSPSAGDVYWLLLIGGGVGILAIDLWTYPAYLAEWKGAGMLLKLALIALWRIAGEWSGPLFWLLVAVSVLVSHAPGRLRGRRWLG